VDGELPSMASETSVASSSPSSISSLSLIGYSPYGHGEGEILADPADPTMD
jgi:hypothetical protein